MADASEAAGLPSLLGVTVRRSIIVGRVSLIIGCIMVTFYSASFGLGGSLFITYGAVVLPIFAVSGGLGGVTVFTNDRTKGVLEYLVAYGMSPRQILLNVMVAAMLSTSIVLAVGIGAGLTTYFLTGHPFTALLAEALLGYTLPMSFGTVGLMTTIGVFWTSLSSPRTGMNSPLGVLPLIGVAPTAGALIVALALPGKAVTILLAVELVVLVVLFSLLMRTNRLMPPDRLLSPA